MRFEVDDEITITVEDFKTFARLGLILYYDYYDAYYGYNPQSNTFVVSGTPEEILHGGDISFIREGYENMANDAPFIVVSPPELHPLKKPITFKGTQ